MFSSLDDNSVDAKDLEKLMELCHADRLTLSKDSSTKGWVITTHEQILSPAKNAAGRPFVLLADAVQAAIKAAGGEKHKSTVPHEAKAMRWIRKRICREAR